MRYVEAIRNRLSPETKTDIDEFGVILPTDGLEISASKAAPDRIPRATGMPPARSTPISLSIFPAGHRRHRRIAARRLPVAVSQRFHDGLEQRQAKRTLLGAEADQGQLPSRRYARQNRIQPWSDIDGQAFVTPAGHKSCCEPAQSRRGHAAAGLHQLTLSTVDEATGDDPPRVAQGSGSTLTLAPFAVTVVSWK